HRRARAPGTASVTTSPRRGSGEFAALEVPGANPEREAPASPGQRASGSPATTVDHDEGARRHRRLTPHRRARAPGTANVTTSPRRGSGELAAWEVPGAGAPRCDGRRRCPGLAPVGET